MPEKNQNSLCCGAELPIDDKQGGIESYSRRNMLEMLGAGGLASILASVKVQPAKAQTDQTLRIGYLPITDSTPLLVAWAKGYFADAGIDAEPPQLIRSWPALIEGFAARRFDVVHMLKPIPIWMRYNNGFPVSVVAWCHTNGSALIVRNGDGITNLAECGGLRFSVPFWYSMHNVVLQMMLRDVGLTPVIQARGGKIAKNEVALNVLPPPEMPIALASGKIDGYIVAEPFNALGELKAGGRVLRFTGDLWRNHPCCVMTMHDDDTQDRPEWSQKVVDAVVRGAAFAKENRQETARLLSKDGEGLLPFPHAVVERAMNHYQVEEYQQSGAQRNAEKWNNNRIDFDPWPYPSATRRMVAAMKDTIVAGDRTFLDELDDNFVANDLVNSRFVASALDRGLFPGHQSRVREETFDL